MPTTNDVTGDKIQSKVVSDDYRDNFDRIFRKESKIDPSQAIEDSIQENKELGEGLSRIDSIGQNGNDGDHYKCQVSDQPQSND